MRNWTDSFMAKAKKRPSKTAKAAKKIVENSKLLVSKKLVKDSDAGSEFKPGGSAPKTSEAIKPRPDKKRG